MPKRAGASAAGVNLLAGRWRIPVEEARDVGPCDRPLTILLRHISRVLELRVAVWVNGSRTGNLASGDWC